jgi:hypothetical protein
LVGVGSGDGTTSGAGEDDGWTMTSGNPPVEPLLGVGFGDGTTSGAGEDDG